MDMGGPTPPPGAPGAGGPAGAGAPGDPGSGMAALAMASALKNKSQGKKQRRHLKAKKRVKRV